MGAAIGQREIRIIDVKQSNLTTAYGHQLAAIRRDIANFRDNMTGQGFLRS
jgi:hypothetical protein